MTLHADIAVIGGGPVGLAFALAASTGARKVIVLEANTGAASDTRTLALAQGSRLILERLGVWSSTLLATEIQSIHVTQRGGFGQTVIHAKDCDTPALGYTLSYRALLAALTQRATERHLQIVEGAQVLDISTTGTFGAVTYSHAGVEQVLSANLIVMADGGRSPIQLTGIQIKNKDYGQVALLARVSADRPHAGIAYERFTSTGPIALLPVGNEFGLVWTVAPVEAVRITALDDASYLNEFQQAFGDYAGKFHGLNSRFQFPLKLRYAAPTTANRIALIGNAAQALHPVAGQGFNLGLRDAEQLARLLNALDAGTDCGTMTLLQKYRRNRLPDTRTGIVFTDGLVRSFSNANPLMRAGRGLGLAALQLAPFARRRLAERMMFGMSP